MTPIRSPRRRLRYAGFGAAILVLLAVAGAMTWSFRRAAESDQWVDHTYQVMTMLHDYQAEALSAESAARGFRLTGEPKLRDEFYQSLPRVYSRLAVLEALVKDSPQQSGNIQRLRLLTERRIAASRALIAVADPPVESARGNLIVTSGSQVMRQIDAQTRAALRFEQTLLDQRHSVRSTQGGLLVAFTAAGMAFAIGMLAILARSLVRENRRTRELERQTRIAASGMERSMAQLARLSEQRGALGRYASLLQSCQDIGEALRVTGHVVDELVPGGGGRCYLLRASQDLAESAIAFGTPAAPSAEILKPMQCWALRRSQPFVVEHLGTGISCEHLDVATASNDAWSICIPLLAQGVPLGLLHLSDIHAEDRLQAQQLLEGVAEQLGLALVNLQLRDTLRVQSLRDPLTGLFNRRYLDESLPREIARCQQQGQPMAVMMLDIDHFKTFNDSNGHAAGDALLAGVGHTLQSLCRSGDLACRYGGEEFTVVLANTDPVHARRRAEEVRAAIAATMVQYLRRPLGQCTASVGLAMFPDDGATADSLLAAADAALYRAKAQGRDRVVAAGAAHA